jgi:hypothetical protein
MYRYLLSYRIHRRRTILLLVIIITHYTTTRYFRVRVTLRLAVYRQSVRLGAEPLETRPEMFSLNGTPAVIVLITSSLMRGCGCHLQLLPVLASTFILGSESHGTRDHILLSQIQDFPFCRFLQLAGLTRYSKSKSKSKSKLLYDWRFTANQFILASSPLRLTTRNFFFPN